VKLIRAERETPALRAFLLTAEGLASSSLVMTEVTRACRREDPALVPLADLTVDSITLLVDVDRGVLRDAAQAEPASLRSLDAIHLATARRLQPDLMGMITYDDRLADAASASGMAVVSPGR
jgi:predicted nucleic acid-binding protein